MTKSEKKGFDPVEDAIAEIANGNMVIVTDDESRENEGDLIMAASKVTPEAVNKMIVHGRGLICVPLLSNQLTRLGISSMVPHNREAQRTDFTVSVDAAEGITTGIARTTARARFEFWPTLPAVPRNSFNLATCFR